MRATSCFLRGALLAATLFALPGWAADPWPAKPVRILHGFSPGAATQTLAQEVGEVLAKSVNANFFVEAKPGAGGNLGSDAVAKSPPDGSTLLVGTSGSHAINATLYKKLTFDPQKDFTPITLLADMPNVLLVARDSPFKSMRDLVEAAKRKPGELNYGSSGNGTSMHLAGEQFKFATGTDILHVPFKESAHALTALIGGQLQLTFHQLPAVMGHIKAGTVRALAVTSGKRVDVIPDVPTVAESGYPGFESVTWYGLFAPAGLPADIVSRINAPVTAALRGDLGRKLIGLGMTPRPSTPAELAQTVATDTGRWKQVIERVGAKVD